MSLGGSYQDHNLIQFKDELSYELQQMGSLLMPTVTIEQVDGKQTYFDKLGKASSYKKTQRGQAKTFFDATFERRILNFETVVSDHLMDGTDILDMVNYNAGDLIKNMAMEIGRQQDEIVAAALSGSVQVQTNGTVASVALPSASKIAVNDHTFDSAGGTNDIGLTPFKLRNALKLLQETYAVNPQQEAVVVVGSANTIMQLTTYDEVISGDYRTTRPVESAGVIGGVQGYLNLNYIAYEGFDADANGDELVYVYPVSAIKAGIRQPLTVEVLPDASRVGNPDTLEALIDMGAVRMYEEKVIEIACDPAVTVSA